MEIIFSVILDSLELQHNGKSVACVPLRSKAKHKTQVTSTNIEHIEERMEKNILEVRSRLLEPKRRHTHDVKRRWNSKGKAKRVKHGNKRHTQGSAKKIAKAFTHTYDRIELE